MGIGKIGPSLNGRWCKSVKGCKFHVSGWKEGSCQFRGFRTPGKDLEDPITCGVTEIQVLVTGARYQSQYC